MSIQLDSIATERELKLRSLAENRIELETALLEAALQPLTLTPAERLELTDTLQLAADQDYGPRDLDRYYVTHPIRVARFMCGWLTPQHPEKLACLQACVIHNALEKEILTPDELRQRFGDWVHDAIVTLTVDRATMPTETGKQAYYKRLSQAPSEVQVIKILDKFDNLFLLCINPDDGVRKSYSDEIETYLLPLAQKCMPEFAPYLVELLADTRRLGFKKFIDFK